MTPTQEALADAARVLRGLSVARELLVFLRKNDFEGFTLSGNAATMDDNERAVIAEYDEAIAATAGDDTALSAVAAWLETQGWRDVVCGDHADHRRRAMITQRKAAIEAMAEGAGIDESRAAIALDALLALLPALGLTFPMPVEADMGMVSQALNYPARLMKDDDTMYQGIFRAMIAAAPNVLGGSDGE